MAYQIVVGLSAITIALGATVRLHAQYTPEHPTVQKMVASGLRFLESKQDRALGIGEYAGGGPILIAYTILKVTGDTEHPKVKAGLAQAARLANSVNQNNEAEGKVVYDASMAAVLLASADAAKYRPELQSLLYFFQDIQKPHGGFGYLGRPTGDTSQVQYVMLALWTMHQVDMEVPVDVVEKTLQYLKATMDPSGAWGYQGKVANGRLVAQERVSKSLATAGAGAMLIGGDILGFYGVRKQPKDDEEGIPDAFVRIDLKQDAKRKRGELTMSRSDTDGAMAMAARYQNTTQFSGLWFYYWLYSQERYESFVEIVNNKQTKSPDWYNRGVEELLKIQDDEGGWGEVKRKDHTPPTISTSLAVLFLIRSTQKAIGKLDAGVTFGGYTLPGDLTTIKMVGERIVSDEETSVENLLTMLEDNTADGVQIGLLPENLQLAKSPAQRKEQVTRLTRLLVSGDYKARQVAARLLGRTDDLNVVPDLIYALTDPNDLVPMIAEESLRLLSRKLNAGNLKQNPTPEERIAAEKYWKRWYLDLKPDYVFVPR